VNSALLSEKLSETDREKIMHISLPLKGGAVLMATDIVESIEPHVVVGNNFSLSIDTESKEEADNLFGKLSEGGKIAIHLHDAFWGSYFGMLTDRFGIQWMINFC
jgi:PhnB protein